MVKRVGWNGYLTTYCGIEKGPCFFGPEIENPIPHRVWTILALFLIEIPAPQNRVRRTPKIEKSGFLGVPGGGPGGVPGGVLGVPGGVFGG